MAFILNLNCLRWKIIFLSSSDVHYYLTRKKLSSVHSISSIETLTFIWFDLFLMGHLIKSIWILLDSLKWGRKLPQFFFSWNDSFGFAVCGSPSDIVDRIVEIPYCFSTASAALTESCRGTSLIPLECPSAIQIDLTLALKQGETAWHLANPHQAYSDVPGAAVSLLLCSWGLQHTS